MKDIKLKHIMKNEESTNEGLSMPVTAVADAIIPKSAINRVKDRKSKQKLKQLLDDLKDTLNQFYAEHDIDWKLR